MTIGDNFYKFYKNIARARKLQASLSQMQQQGYNVTTTLCTNTTNGYIHLDTNRNMPVMPKTFREALQADVDKWLLGII